MEVRLGNHEIYNSKEEIEEEIADIHMRINGIKMRLFGMVCGDIDRIFPATPDWTVVEHAENDFTLMLEDENGLEHLLQHLVDLQYIHDNFERAEIG